MVFTGNKPGDTHHLSTYPCERHSI